MAGRDSVIPNAVILPRDPSGQSPPAQANDIAKESTKTQIMVLGKNSVIPIIYGGPERVAGKLYIARIYQDKLLLVLIMCEGPVQSMGTVDMNDEDLPPQVVVTKYNGTQVIVDPTIAAAIPGFAEVMPNTAYIVALVPKGISSGFPRFTCLITGRLVFDPRQKAVDTGAGTGVATISSAAAINFGTGSFTVEGWFYHRSLTGGVRSFAPISKHGTSWNTTAGWGIGQASNGTGYNISIHDGTNFASATPTLDDGYRPNQLLNQWVHVAVVFDRTAGRAYIYINGVLQSSNLNISAVTGSVNNSLSLFVGNTVGWGIDGGFNDVHIWNTALSQALILSRKDLKVLGTETNIIALWNFNTGSGSTELNYASSTFGTLTATLSGHTWTNGVNLGPMNEYIQSIWSDNPALCLANLQSNSVYGGRKVLNWTSVRQAADFCDSLVSGEKRNIITLTIAEKRPIKDWLDALRSYIPGWINYDKGIASIIPDMARSTDHIFNSTTIDTTPPPAIKKRGIKDIPSVVEIGYMRTDIIPWSMHYAIADTGAIIRRKTRIDMPGIRRYSQAKRFAIERLNHYYLEDLEGYISVFENGLKVSIGDVIEITDDLFTGYSSALKARVMSVDDRGHGRWGLAWREYDPLAYSSVVESTPNITDTGLPDPRVVAAPTSLSITEEIYLEKSLSADYLARGLIYQSRFSITWVASSHAYPVIYRVIILDGINVIHEGNTPDLKYATPTVQQGKEYTVKIIARNSIGVESSALVGNRIALGKNLVPGNVPAITSAFELGGEVFLQWDPAIDIDITRYEWRYGPTGSFNWVSNSTLIDRIDGLRAQFKGLPIGTWRFAVKAIDSVGQYSPVETTVDVVLTSDTDAFIQYKDFSNPFSIGSDIVQDGDFDGSPGSVWAFGTGGSISGGKLNAASVANGVAIAYQTLLGGPTIGKTYLIAFTIDSISAGGVSIHMGASSGLNHNAAGSFRYVVTSVLDGNLYIVANGTTTCVIDNISVREVSNIQEIERLEGSWIKRWAVGHALVNGVSSYGAFYAIGPNPINSGSNSIFNYHLSATSRFIGESWDFGTVVSGDWSMTPNLTNLNGTATYALETSADGSTWAKQPGLTWKGATRFIRPYIETLGSGTFVINAPPRVNLAALSKTEAAEIKTLSAGNGGKLVQLTGQYVGAQDLQLTAVNTTLPRSPVADRILVHPQTGLMLQYDYISAGDAQITQKIYSRPGGVGTGYQSQTSDILIYDVFLDPSSPAASVYSFGDIIIVYDDADTTGGDLVDQNGYSIWATSLGADSLLRGQWYNRICTPLPSRLNNKFINYITIGSNADIASGTAKLLYRNIRIKRGGTDYFQTIWTSGEPQTNINGTSALINNVKCGPSNSFMTYCFDDTGTQVAQDIRYNFKGF